MKRIIAYIIFAVLSLGAANGQRISVSEPVQTNDGQTLTVSVRIGAAGLDVRKAGGYKLVLSAGNRDAAIVMPGVKYLSGQRAMYERRREALYGSDVPAAYEVFTKVRRDRIYETDYKVSLPYYSWMGDAVFSYVLYRYESDGLKAVTSGNIGPVMRSDMEHSSSPDPQMAVALTEYICPGTDRNAKRSETLAVNIEYQAGDPMLNPSHGANASALAKIDGFMALHFGGPLKARDLYITGYGSPDGKFADNEQLVMNRTKAMEKYLRSKYGLTEAITHTSWVAEDWDGLIRAIEADPGIPRRGEVKSAIASGIGREPDAREWLIKVIDDRRPYNYLLGNIYPSLRRIELEADYTGLELSDAQVKELALAHPEKLGPNDLCRAAAMFDEGSVNRRRILEAAVKQYPDDCSANNNIAVSLLREGNARAAYPFLQKISGDARAWVNIGAYYYLSGDLVHAREYFGKAAAEGIARGRENLKAMER